MRIECPHCHNGIEVVLDSPSELVSCPACGSSFSLFDPQQTTSFHEREAKLVGRFRLIDHVGSGHFGDVWKAHDSTLDREVALKVPRKETLTADDAERFIREARVAAQMRHPHVVQVLEVGKADDLLFIVSEFVAGMNLSQWLTINKPDPLQTARLCATLADALHHAHEAGIVHRDLKPANVLMDSQGQAHLTDFGLAKRDGGEITMTVGGEILGTPAYMSPEQARGDAHNADRRSDVYSLGVMLYEMLAGNRPFKASSRLMLIEQVLYCDAPRLRKQNKRVPIDLETICLKALEKAPERRYQTAKEMGDDLRRFIEGRPIVARRITHIERGWRWARRNPTVASLLTTAAGLLILVGVLGWLYAAGTKDTPQPRKVRFTTNPPGAHVVFVPIDRDTGEPIADQAVRPQGVTPLETKLKPGIYLVVAVIDGHGFHEVYRQVPEPGDEHSRRIFVQRSWTVAADGAIELPAIENIPTTADATARMALFPGGAFDAGSDQLLGARRHRRTVTAFWLAQTEVTVAQYKKVKNGVPSELAEIGGAIGDSDPVTFVTYFNAIDFAERSGARLPLEFEYEFAATNGGTQKYPWGDDESKLSAWPIGPVRTPIFDQTNSRPPVFGLYSGVAELTDSRLEVNLISTADHPAPRMLLEQNRNSRVYRGGPSSVARGKPNQKEWMATGPRYRMATISEAQGLPGLGFRLARSADPRFQLPTPTR